MSDVDWLKRPSYTQAKALSKADKSETAEYELANLRAKFIEPLRASIASLITHPVVSIAGNRVQLLTTAAIASLTTIFAQKDIAEGDLVKISSKAVAAALLLILSNAMFGSFTAYTYARTKRMLEEKGEVPDQFINKAVSDTYCTAQGVYLALKDDEKSSAKLKEILKKEHPVTRWLLF